MNKKTYFNLILISLLLLTSSISVAKQYYSIEKSSLSSLETLDFKSPSMPLAAGGEEPLKTNILSNGNFEEESYNGGPKGFTTYNTGYAYSNFSYDVVHGGTKACLIESLGTKFSGSTGRIGQYFSSSSLPYLTDNLNLGLWLYLISMPDFINGSYFRLYLQFYNEISSEMYYLYYYFSYGGAQSSNSTYNGYIYLNYSLSTWHNIQRDISSDFNTVFGSLPSNTYASRIRMELYSPYYPVDFSKVIVDDISVKDSSLNEYIVNGDFESGDTNWTAQINGAANISLSEEHTQGLHSLNLTSVAYYPNGYSYAQINKYMATYEDQLIGWNFYSPGDLVIEFDWWYSDVTNGGSGQSSYLLLSLTNGTYQINFYLYLGSYLDKALYANYTGSNSMTLYYSADNIGSRETWNHQVVDLYYYVPPENFTNMALTYIYFTSTAGYHENSSTTLLIDDLKFNVAPLNDPGFEHDYYYSATQPLATWTSHGDPPYVNLTTDAHTGKYAVNITGTSFVSSYVYNVHLNMLITPDIYTDFWYKLLKLAEGTESYVYVELNFNESYDLRYVIGKTDVATLSNNSDVCYYLLPELNQTGNWIELVRNVYSDLTAAFGDKVWILTQVSFYVYSAASATSVLFDDVNFVRDTHPPIINNVQILNTPTYYTDAEIEIEVNELLGPLFSVKLFYRNDSTWYQIDATRLNPTTYRALIPHGRAGTTYQFYITATDISGLSSTDNNGGQYYSYTVTDDIAPTIEINEPANASVLSDTITVTVTVADAGSAISRVEYYIDGELIGNVSSAPFTYEWNTRDTTNGLHTLMAKAYDEGNNYATDSIKITTKNDFDPPEISSAQLLPDPLKANKPVTVIVAVSDASGIENVTLHYKAGNGTWTEVSMVSNASLYSAEIPAVSYNVEVLYYIEATDVYGQQSFLGTMDDPMSYIIKPTIGTIYNNYGMLLGAGAVVILYGLIKLIMWRAGKKK